MIILTVQERNIYLGENYDIQTSYFFEDASLRSKKIFYNTLFMTNNFIYTKNLFSEKQEISYSSI